MLLRLLIYAVSVEAGEYVLVVGRDGVSFTTRRQWAVLVAMIFLVCPRALLVFRL